MGIPCVQIAKALGLNVIGTAGTEEGIDLVLKQGATVAFNHRKRGYSKKIVVCISEICICTIMIFILII